MCKQEVYSAAQRNPEESNACLFVRHVITDM